MYVCKYAYVWYKGNVIKNQYQKTIRKNKPDRKKEKQQLKQPRQQKSPYPTFPNNFS